MKGTPCKASSIRETCLQIGPDHARQYVNMGIARFITKDEALKILDAAQEAGLILNPENSQNPETICCCCGDCCAFFKAVKRSPHWSDFFATKYFAVVDASKCTGCGNCVQRCQLDARTVVAGKAVTDLSRCIGCGNCVTHCVAQASALRLKKGEMLPPKTKDDTYWKILAGRRGRSKALVLKLKTRLGLDV